MSDNNGWVKVADRAPKKGEDVLVWCFESNEQFVGFHLGDGRFQFGIGRDGIVLCCRPSYWRELPPPPNSGEYDFSDMKLEGI